MHEKLQADRLEKDVQENCQQRLEVAVFDSIDSTNTRVMHWLEEGKRPPFACFAEHQQSGRGRRGKTWLMPPRSNIALSLCWAYEQPVRQLQYFPVSVALVIARFLETLSLDNVMVKWPNDIYVNDRKISGILIETRTVNCAADCAGTDTEPAGRQLAIVIGIGLNYDMSAQDTGEMPASTRFTDIFQQAMRQGKSPVPERNRIASDLLCDVVSLCQRFPGNIEDDLLAFSTRYDYCRNKALRLVLDNGRVVHGIAQGINERAELLVLVDGRQLAFNSAEVSVKI